MALVLLSVYSVVQHYVSSLQLNSEEVYMWCAVTVLRQDDDLY